MYYLIDGYNLLHALGMVGSQPNRRITLDLARRQLLEMVYKAHRDEPEHVTVVFDAAHGPKKRAETSHKKSTRLNSSHVAISYAVFCLKKKKKKNKKTQNKERLTTNENMT